jgi:flagellar biosynthesis/type III secretory pathway protein FliH
VKVVKSANIFGTLSSFVPQMEIVPLHATKPLEVLQQKSVAPLELLLTLSLEERKETLSKLFADELNLLEKQAKDEGFAIGKSQAELEAKPLLENKLEELSSCISAWKKMLLEEAKTQTWKLDNEETFIALLFQGTTKLLSKELSEPKHIGELVAQLIEKYADNKPKKLMLPPAHYQHLLASEHFNSLNDFEIISCPDMLPGSYKLYLASGHIEYDLTEALNEFRTGLLNLSAHSKDDE